MIFADKLMMLRKKSGWSQEELADQLNVTRQSVSKWEGAQSIPDIDKMIRISELFNVSTDYLLKDEMEEMEFVSDLEDAYSLKRVSLNEANAFLSAKQETSKIIAFATLLCILSPISLLVLGVISEYSVYGISSNVAGGIGIIVLLALVTIAVALFIMSGSKTAPFEYLEKEIFETEYGVSGMVKALKEKEYRAYTNANILGTCLCILSAIPLFAGVMIEETNGLMMVLMLAITIILVAIGVFIFIRANVVWASYEKLLQEGDYSKQKKERNMAAASLSVVYWSIVTAIYLLYSFSMDSWKNSWIIWVVAGVLYPAFVVVVNVLTKKK